MDKPSKVKYWIEISDYDLEIADTMLTGKRYLYVGFMCHQAIEKILKAYYVKINNENAPYTHNLRYLCEKSMLLEMLTEENKLFIRELEPLNIESRYPEYKEKLLKQLNNIRCVSIITKTKELQKWIKEKL